MRLHKPEWIDPYPHIPGTKPEKMLFAALIERGIFFIYQGQVQELERGVYVSMAIPGYKPDFIIPHYKVIIDPFSEFHHTLPDAVERDVRKIALYTALGYAYYHPWAHEITGLPGKPPMPGPHGVIARIKELNGKPKRELTKKQKRLAVSPGYEIGPYVGAGANSVAAANKARRRPTNLALSVRGRGRRNSRQLY